MRQTETIDKSGRTGLVRGMTRWHLVGMSINGIIGAGIFGLPAAVAKILGPASPIAFALCALITYSFVLCFAEAASHFKETGGPYLYSRTVFGRLVGFEVGWSAWLARVSAFGANSNLLVSYIAFFSPRASEEPILTVLLTIVTATLMLINIRGVTGGARFGAALAILKVGALLLFVIVGLVFVNWNQFSAVSITTQLNWGQAILLLIYAFTGFEVTTVPAAEARDPQRDIGSALVIALLVCAILYIAVQTVAIGTVDDLASSQRPLVESARLFWGPSAGALISVLVCISIVGNLSGSLLNSPRMTFAMAEHGEIPAFFAKVHPVYRTPVVSIICFALVSLILAASGTFVWLATVSVIARLVTYLATCLAVPGLRKRATGPGGFRLPLGPVIPVIGTVLCGWLFLQASIRDLVGFSLAALVGAGLYLVRPRHQTQP